METPLDLKEIQRADLEKVSCVYGPVRSWRVGASLGIDLLCVNSICSFNCVYCQLGSIQVRTNERRLFVPTEKVVSDLKTSRWREADIVTFSGNGEPCLGLNLGECIRQVKALTGKPALVLTSGSLLHMESVRDELAAADRVYVKLDAASEETFQRVNRPVEGIRLRSIVDAIQLFRRTYPGFLGIQSMFLRANLSEVDALGELLNRIRPDELQLNTPTRPYPSQWVVETRGSHGEKTYPARPLKQVSRSEASRIERRLRELTGGKVKILSVYGSQAVEPRLPDATMGPVG